MSQKISGIKKIKTAQKTKLHSKPRVEGQEYLELYLMTKARDRLKRYHEVITETRECTAEEIENVEQEFEKLEKKVGIDRPDSHSDVKAAGTDSPKNKKRKPAKSMKTVVIDY
ncbi:MAG: hypothetical protein Q7J27_10545 [Syntrophales bacterium]|nr:hypothetical protein [Syntrophales bacterium]